MVLNCRLNRDFLKFSTRVRRSSRRSVASSCFSKQAPRQTPAPTDDDPQQMDMISTPSRWMAPWHQTTYCAPRVRYISDRRRWQMVAQGCHNGTWRGTCVWVVWLVRSSQGQAKSVKLATYKLQGQKPQQHSVRMNCARQLTYYSDF